MRPPRHLAILIAVILRRAFGLLWYAPFLFGPVWERGVGDTMPHTPPATPIPAIVIIAATFAGAYGLDWLMRRLAIEGAGPGALFGAIIGALFIAPAAVVHGAFLGHPLEVQALNAGVDVLGTALIGAVLGGFPKPRAG